jgi:hypothetical protein
MHTPTLGTVWAGSFTILFIITQSILQEASCKPTPSAEASMGKGKTKSKIRWLEDMVVIADSFGWGHMEGNNTDVLRDWKHEDFRQKMRTTHKLSLVKVLLRSWIPRPLANTPAFCTIDTSMQSRHCAPFTVTCAHSAFEKCLAFLMGSRLTLELSPCLWLILPPAFR